MKHFSVALIVIALIAADFGATWLGFSHAEQHAWGWIDSFGLVGAAYWFTFKTEKS